jgi:hypothetical protein
MPSTPTPAQDGLTGRVAALPEPVAQSDPLPHQGIEKRRPLRATAVVAGWVGVVVLAARLDPAPSLRPYALFGHLVCLAVSFGAVLAVELHGLGFLLRRVSTDRMATVALSLDPLIWAGLIGMCTTGVVLGPHLDRPLTVVKLGAVLVVALNGLWARDLARELRSLPSAGDRSVLPPGVLRRATRTSVVSQLGWWSAVVIGFLTTNG